jgi:hypothetical protein
MRKAAALILALATALAVAVNAVPARACDPAPDATVSYAFWIDTDGAPYSDRLIGGLMNATNADYEADSPYCTVAELAPNIDAYACIGVPLAEAGPYADDTSYDVHFTDDGELATADGDVLEYWTWTV